MTCYNMTRKGILCVFLHDSVYFAVKKLAVEDNRIIGNMLETLLKKCLKDKGFET